MLSYVGDSCDDTSVKDTTWFLSFKQHLYLWVSLPSVVPPSPHWSYTHSFLPSFSSCLAKSLSFSSCRLILFWYCLSLSLCCFSCCNEETETWVQTVCVQMLLLKFTFHWIHQYSSSFLCCVVNLTGFTYCSSLSHYSVPAEQSVKL